MRFPRITSPLTLLCLLLLFEVGGYYILYRQPAAVQIGPQPQTRGYQFSRPEQELVEFSGQVSKSGARVYSLKGYKLIIQKKKIGFFRFGMLKEAAIDQASFDLTYYPGDSFMLGKSGHGHNGGAPDMAAGFFGNVSALVCMPITFTVNQAGQTGTKARIVADRADFLADGKTVKFRGKIRLNSGKVSMETDEMDLSMADCQIAVKRSYVFVTERGRVSGHGMRSDVFLSSLDKGEIK